jgi:carbamoyl-phosphate synthase large subunit
MVPKNKTIKKVLIIGSGPIQIGQAAEFDYSGSQACKSLKELGYEIVLVNSNPATIMTDPEMADEIYIEPLTFEVVEKIIEKEKPDAILPTLGGQTALNLAVEMANKGILDKHNVELIGAKLDAINKAEDRELFKEACQKVGISVLKSEVAYTLEESINIAEKLGYPVVIRPAFTLGGTGGGIAFNLEELKKIASKGLEYSLTNQVLIEESIIGWKEYEYEVIRDLNDNVIIVCTIENMDPMGIHTGDSITVAPTQTLSDEEYQLLRDYSIKIIREIGVETGGSNIQFAINPENRRVVAIEMNPRVSRSSALASKATGYPIAKVAAKLAVGLTLDEIKNEITGTSAAFEPTIDYVVVKIPRWDFDKFLGVDNTLTTQMKSVGEVMAMGRTFEEAFLKALRSLDLHDIKYQFDERRLDHRNPKGGISRVYDIFEILKMKDIDEAHKITKIDPWFLNKMKNIVDLWDSISDNTDDPDTLLKLKKYGISDKTIASIWGKSEKEIRDLRKKQDITPKYKMVDTCGAEFEAKTPYYYSTYNDDKDEVESTDDINGAKKIIVLGSGPNRIGQGIEFDYSCVHTIKSLKEEGFETIMVNCNPETVSTDFDLADRLYFEPLYLEDVLNIIEKENPYGVIVQVGGQTPINLAVPLGSEGVRILGTSHESIDRAEDRGRFTEVLEKLEIPQAPYGTAKSFEDAKEIAKRIGFPVLVRPSYVLGGRAMEIVYDKTELEDYMSEAVRVSPKHPILVDKFLEDAVELDVDALCDGEDVFIGGIMEHIEEAGVHSGDSACVIPPQTITESVIDKIKEYTRKLALELNVVGLINIQYAVKTDGEPEVYILEANPRSSRTVPFVSKATGIPLAKIAAKLMIGYKLKSLGLNDEISIDHVAVKESVFPFIKLPGADAILGPEMKSTGESMGIDENFEVSYYKSQLSANMKLPTKGKIFISVKDADKNKIHGICKKARGLGFELLATRGTARAVEDMIKIENIKKISQGSPNIKEAILNGEVDLIINTPSGKQSTDDGYFIRRTAIELGIPYVTTLVGARAALNAIEKVKDGEIGVKSLNEYHHR